MSQELKRPSYIWPNSYSKRVAALSAIHNFSIVVPTFRTPPAILLSTIYSILDQALPPRELILVDDSGDDSTVRSTVESIAHADPRLKVVVNLKNIGISESTNVGVALAGGDFVFFVDHDDELTPDALLSFAECMEKDSGNDIWYSDQCTIDKNGEVLHHFLKPDWSPAYATGVMYVGHLLAVRRQLCFEVKFRSEYNGVQDYDFLLRLSEKTQRIGHVQSVCYKWRAIEGSLAFGVNEKSGIERLQALSVNEHFARTKKTWNASIHPFRPHRLVIGPSKASQEPRISIVIPTKNQGEILSRCLESIYTLTDYENFEVILVDNRTTDPFALQQFKSYPCARVAYNDKAFNYSKANNIGVDKATGDLILFLNNDTEVLDCDWISNLAVFMEDDGIGAVGATLLYPNRSIQHAGVLLGPRGTADHLMRGFAEDSDGYGGSLPVAREVSAVTAACLLMKKKLFIEIGGFSTDYSKHYQDVDLCLKIRERGMRIVSAGTVRLIHHESLTRKVEGYDLGDRAVLIDHWRDKIASGDPYYNRGFIDGSVDYSIKSNWIA